jgi:hypothetical protein
MENQDCQSVCMYCEYNRRDDQQSAWANYYCCLDATYDILCSQKVGAYCGACAKGPLMRSETPYLCFDCPSRYCSQKCYEDIGSWHRVVCGNRNEKSRIKNKNRKKKKHQVEK